jgi:hypothetical protein
MQPSSTPSFDLLELAWWQNPWWYVAGASVLVFLIGLGVYYMIRRYRLSPKDRFLQQLATLQKLPRQTHEQQKHLYTSLTELLKKSTAFAFNIPEKQLLSLTDQEFQDLINQRTDVPERWKLLTAQVSATATQVKFAEQAVDPEIVAAQLQRVQEAFALFIPQDLPSRPAG